MIIQKGHDQHLPQTLRVFSLRNWKRSFQTVCFLWESWHMFYSFVCGLLHSLRVWVGSREEDLCLCYHLLCIGQTLWTPTDLRDAPRVQRGHEVMIWDLADRKTVKKIREQPGLRHDTNCMGDLHPSEELVPQVPYGFSKSTACQCRDTWVPSHRLLSPVCNSLQQKKTLSTRCDEKGRYAFKL